MKIPGFKRRINSKIFRDDENVRVRLQLNKAQARFRAQNTNRRRKTVALRCVWRDDCRLDPLCQAESGFWICDVRITDSTDFNELLRVARSRDAAVAQEQYS